MIAAMEPVVPPLHAMFQPPFVVGALNDALSAGGAFSVYEAEVEQPLSSVRM